MNPPATGPYELRPEDISDGLSNTLLVGEVNYGHESYLWENCEGRENESKWGDHTWAHGYWWHAWGHISAKHSDLYNSRVYAAPDSNRVFRSDHPGGVQFAMVEGSVRFVADYIDAGVLNALATRDGGEAVSGEFE